MPYGTGDVITLAGQAARTSSGAATGVELLTGSWLPRRIGCILSCTAHATDAGDTLDVFIDVSADGSTWLNAGHFTQIPGNATPAGGPKEILWLSVEGSPGTSTIAVANDATSGVVRPYAVMRYIRARWEIADVGDTNASHTFKVTAFVA